MMIIMWFKGGIYHLLLQTKIGSGKLMGPKGVSVDRNGHIIVVDNKACCVFIFQPNGKIVTRFGTRGNGDKQFAGKLHNMWATFSCGIFPDIAWIIHTRDYLQKECHLREALGPVFLVLSAFTIVMNVSQFPPLP